MLVTGYRFHLSHNRNQTCFVVDAVAQIGGLCCGGKPLHLKL